MTTTRSRPTVEAQTGRSGRTKYGRLARKVERDIEAGLLQPGEAVPSIRRLMASSKLSKATVIRSLSLLEERGLVRCHPQRGYFVSERGGGARRLATQFKQIAFISPALTGDTEPYAKGISSALDADRFALATFSTHGDLEAYGELVRRVVELRPAGLVLASVRPSLMRLDAQVLAEADVPVVLVGHQAAGVSCDRVSEGKAAAARHLVDYLLSKGYGDDMALICCGKGELTPEDSMAWSVRQELARAQIGLGNDAIFTLPGIRGYGTHPDPYGESDELVTDLLEQGRRFRVLICDHDYPGGGGRCGR